MIWLWSNDILYCYYSTITTFLFQNNHTRRELHIRKLSTDQNFVIVNSKPFFLMIRHPRPHNKKIKKEKEKKGRISLLHGYPFENFNQVRLTVRLDPCGDFGKLCVPIKQRMQLQRDRNFITEISVKISTSMVHFVGI